tara:strand:- start:1573 stop:2046 length:474 start_codon:yes stop_codon:yes gene_type:complete
MNKIAVFPGSFDPFTIGHKEIVHKIFPIFDKIIIAVGENRDKKCFFSIDQRINWIKKIFDKEKIFVKKYTGLTTNFCKKENANFIIRGIRDSNDFIYEKKIAHINKDLNSSIETLFILSSKENSHISSSFVKDVIKNKGNIKKFLPNEIATSILSGF